MFSECFLFSYFFSRTNSRKTAVKWRETVPLKKAQIAQERCKEIFNRLGYINLNTEEEMKNMSLPVFRGAKSVPGIWT